MNTTNSPNFSDTRKWTFYVTFGQAHHNYFDKHVFDKDCLLEVQAHNYDQVKAFCDLVFFKQYSMIKVAKELNDIDIKMFFPRGVIMKIKI